MQKFRQNREKNKLKKELFVLIMLSLLAFALVLLTIEGGRTTSRERALDAQQRNVNTRIANDLDQYTKSVVRALAASTLVPAINQGSTQECNDKIKEYKTLLPVATDTLSRMNSQGDFDCSTDKGTLGYFGPNLPHLKEIIEDPSHDTVIGRVTKSLTGDKFFVSIHVPRYDADKAFIGTIGSAIFFDEVGEEFINPIDDLSQYVFYLVDDNGQIMYAENPELICKDFAEALQGDHLDKGLPKSFDLSGTSEPTQQHNGVTVSTVSPIEGRSWRLVSIQKPLTTDGLAFGDVIIARTYAVIGALVAAALLVTALTIGRLNKHELQKKADSIT